MRGNFDPTRVDPNLATNFGARRGFDIVPTAGGLFQLQNNAQLITAQVPRSMPWVITVEPCTKKVAQGTSPWFTPLDGVVNGGVIGGNDPQNSSAGYKVVLTWGAGGIRQSAVFDYPMAGGSFSLVADTVDMFVVNPFGAAPPTYSDPDATPIFGAFMVPGELATDAGMMLSDVPQSAAAAIGQVARWWVKPHARWLYVSQRVAANAAAHYSVSFSSASAADDLWVTFLGQDAGNGLANAPVPIPVPPQATLVKLANLDGGGGGMLWNILWGLRFG